MACVANYKCSHVRSVCEFRQGLITIVIQNYAIMYVIVVITEIYVIVSNIFSSEITCNYYLLCYHSECGISLSQLSQSEICEYIVLLSLWADDLSC